MLGKCVHGVVDALCVVVMWYESVMWSDGAYDYVVCTMGLIPLLRVVVVGRGAAPASEGESTCTSN